MKIQALVALALVSLPAAALELRWPEGTLRGFPALRDQQGRLLADGSLTQWIERGELLVKVIFEFRDGRRIQEQAAFQQEPRLEQRRWSWVEQRDDHVLRRFEVDFGEHRAFAQKWEKGQLQHWEESIDVEPDKTFAGMGFMFALKNLRDRLEKGEKVELKAIAFTPKPRTATVTLSHEGVESLRLGRRTFDADRFMIHPEIPAIARLFVKAPDQHVWLYRTAPPVLLRAEAPLAEPGDPIVRIDALPGTSAPEAHAPERAANRPSDSR